MGTIVNVLAAVLAVFAIAAFVFLFYVKLNALDVHNPWKYASRHNAAAPRTAVPRTYIPAGMYIHYREMWRARIEGTAEFLRVPISQLGECYQRGLAERLSNWKWMHVPSSEWPTVWQ
jgi:hypothetical protein